MVRGMDLGASHTCTSRSSQLAASSVGSNSRAVRPVAATAPLQLTRIALLMRPVVVQTPMEAYEHLPMMHDGCCQLVAVQPLHAKCDGAPTRTLPDHHCLGGLNLDYVYSTAWARARDRAARPRDRRDSFRPSGCSPAGSKLCHGNPTRPYCTGRVVLFAFEWCCVGRVADKA
jgi:hypothetical protein